ncbi:MAG: hypothetical protein H5U07_02300 [Candidatus Aminicenantes bacterium]|nr:hypothetical protein [Candidatus Aminicenantes bacterium]
MEENIDQVEYYAGGRGQETPLAVHRQGKRILVIKVLSEKRVLDVSSGQTREWYKCLLENGEVIEVKRLLSARDQSGI